MPRRLVNFFLALLILAGSFSGTLAYLRYRDNKQHLATGPGGSGPLARLNLQSATDVEQSAPAAGLKNGPTLLAKFDGISRDASGLVHFAGYAFDQVGAGNPVTIYMIMNGRVIGKTQAKGPREDIAESMKLRPEIAANAAFDGQSAMPMACESTAQPFGLVINQKSEFLIVQPASLDLRCG